MSSPGGETEEMVVFRPGEDATTETIAGFRAFEASPAPAPVDRGSRAETVAYGGGLRASPRRIVVASLVVALLIALLGTAVYLVNEASAGTYSAVIVPANLVDLSFQQSAPLLSIEVRPGEHVRAGQILAVQSNKVDQLALLLATATLNSAAAHLAALTGSAGTRLGAEESGLRSRIAADQSRLAALDAAYTAQRTAAAAVLSADQSIVTAAEQLQALTCSTASGGSSEQVRCLDARLEVERARAKVASDEEQSALLATRSQERTSALSADISSREAALAALTSAGTGITPASAEAIRQARLQLAQARLAVAIDRAKLAQFSLRSPVSGTVLRVDGIPGEIVGPGGVRGDSLGSAAIPSTASFHLFPEPSGPSSSGLGSSAPVVTIVTGRRWQVLAEIPESTVTSLRRGAAAVFQFQDFGGLSERCRMSEIVPVAIESGSTLEYEVTFRLLSRAPRGTLPGMSGTLRLG
jgi:multidrug efflux pump subunit AcrA (membrane-fusion protein)